MLAKYWRLHCYWVGDQTLTYDSGARIAVRLSPWKIASGALSYGTTITEDFGFGAGDTIATGEMESIGSTNDNTSNLYWGVKGFVSLIADVSGSTGTLYLYLDESDDNTNWPGGGR